MTCIVGLEKKGVVWIGGDSAGTNSHLDQQIRADKKVFIKDKFIFGFSGSFRAGQLLRCELVIPQHDEGKDDFTYLVKDFVDAVKRAFSSLSGDEASPYFLFGYNGKLYGMQGDYQISSYEHGFSAVGSGAAIALGAMHASSGVSSPRKRITQALEASALNNAGVRPPFTILSLKK